METLLIYSGGLDSTVLLYKLLQVGGIVALQFDYGSKHTEMERAAAQRLCQENGVELIELSLPFIQESFQSSLLKGGEALPHGEYERNNMKSTVVPFRNGILLSIAIGIAESRGIREVAYGAHAGDHEIYPDCRPQFFNKFAEVAKLGTYAEISLTAPLLNLTKGEIVKLGSELGVPFERTYSCYAGGERHCGECGTCVERKRAFQEAGISDPTSYFK